MYETIGNIAAQAASAAFTNRAIDRPVQEAAGPFGGTPTPGGGEAGLFDYSSTRNAVSAALKRQNEFIPSGNIGMNAGGQRAGQTPNGVPFKKYDTGTDKLSTEILYWQRFLTQGQAKTTGVADL